MVRIFNQYVPKPFVFLGILETCIFIVSIYAGKEYRFSIYREGQFDQPLWGTALIFAVVMVSAMTATGLYQRRSRNSGPALIIRIVASFFLGVLAMSVVFYMLPGLFLGRGALGASVIVGFVGVVVARFIFLRLTGGNTFKRRILVLGAGRNAKLIADMLVSSEPQDFTVVNFAKLQGEPNLLKDPAVIETSTPLVEFAQRKDVDEVVVAVDDRRKGLPLHELLHCKMSGIEVVELVTFFERETQKLKLDLVHPSWMIFSDGFRGGFLRTFSKRFFDIFASLFLLSIAWPFMAITALAIWLEGGGRAPILYRQVRVGQYSRPFEVLKFRSMRADAEEDGIARWASKDDDRITRIGRLIRNLRIDELPQVFNVLRGDMSFVGPRPERPSFVAELEQVIPYYRERHWAKPGITGWAQLCYPYGASQHDAFEKLQYDLYYAKNHSFVLDLMILLQTAEVILWGKGAR